MRGGGVALRVVEQGIAGFAARRPLEQRNFSRLWLAQTVSLAGSEVTVIALPLAAVLQLHSSPAQVGFLRAATVLAFPLCGMLVGVLADRVRRHRMLVLADLGRAAVLMTIPLAAVLRMLRIEYLYVAAFLTGLLTTVFEVAYQAFLPNLIGADLLVPANGRLEGSRAAAQIAGPSVGGTLVQLFTAPFAILANAITYLVSAAFLSRIRVEERASDGSHPPALRAIAAGVAALLGNAQLRSITMATAIWNLAWDASVVSYLLFVLNTLHLGPIVLGGVLVVAGVGSVIGAGSARSIATVLGLGPALIVGLLISGTGNLVPAWIPAGAIWTLPMLIAGQALNGVGVPIFNVNQTSFRQASVPADLQGRVHATFRSIVWGVKPVGSVLGGLLATTIGLRPALAVCGIAMLMASVWLLISPVRHLRIPAGAPTHT